MRKIVLCAVTLMGALFATSGAMGAEQGFQVKGTQLIDSMNEVLVMRGVNIPHVWFPEHTKQSIESASRMGCNTVRIVLANGGQWERVTPEELKQLLNWCERYGLIAVLEVHDATGYGDKTEAADPRTAIEFWLDPGIQKVLNHAEHAVIINIANEPFGNSASEQWLEFHLEAIKRLRDAGYKHTLMVDAAHWGQDWKKMTLDNGAAILESDPMKNVMFSVHMYEYYGTADVVQDYLHSSQERGLCMIVGEFGMEHFGKPVAAGAIMETCQQLGLGYLGWSWSGNGGGNPQLDLVIDFDPAQLSPWGEFLFNHPTAGIKVTSRKTDVFGWD